MKKSYLRQIIREEVRKSLKESDPWTREKMDDLDDQYKAANARATAKRKEGQEKYAGFDKDIETIANWLKAKASNLGDSNVATSIKKIFS